MAVHHAPSNESQRSHHFGVIPFHRYSSVSGTSYRVLLNNATSTNIVYLLLNYILTIALAYINVNYSSSSTRSILLTDTSYATRFSTSFSSIFFVYSLLCTLPLIFKWPPTWIPDANLAFLPHAIHGM